MKFAIKNIVKLILKNMPTNDSWIVFESHSDFCDNSRALFEYMYRNKMYNKYKFIWLVDDKNKFKDMNYTNTVFINIEPKTIYGRMKLYLYNWLSKYRFLSHRIIDGYSKHQITVNLWHGTLLKSVKGCVPTGEYFDYLLAPTEYFKDIYLDQFACEEKQLLYLGYPRNDMLFDSTNYRNIFIDSNCKSVIMWMPTYRKHKNGKMCDSKISMKYGVPIIESESQLMELDEFLEKCNGHILIKVHPAQDLTYISNIKCKNITLLTNKDLDDKNINLYSLLGETDALITDYSSIYFDYLLLDKQIAFTVTDSEEYGRSRGYVFDNPLDIMPGVHIKSMNELKEFIISVNKIDKYTKERNNVNKKVNKYIDSDSCKRIVEYFEL